MCIHIHTCVCLCVQGAHTFIWRTHIFLHFVLLLRQDISVNPGSSRGLSIPSHLATGDHLSLCPSCWYLGSHCAHLPFMWLRDPNFCYRQVLSLQNHPPASVLPPRSSVTLAIHSDSLWPSFSIFEKSNGSCLGCHSKSHFRKIHQLG